MEDNISKKELSNIVEDLYNEFYEEKVRLDSMYQEQIEKLEEIEHYIEELEKDDAADFNVFSPRNVRVNYTDKIEQLKKEQKETEEEKERISKKRHYYEERVHKLEEYRINEVEMEDEVKEDNASILLFQEKEKQRISRDLHDTTVQDLTHLIHKSELCMKYIDSDPIRAKLELESLHKGIKEIVNDMRTTIFNLRPMAYDDLGFQGAVEHMMEVFQNNTSVKLVYNIDGNYDKISDIVLISIIRMIQEACINALKYSKAKNLNLDCKIEEDTICIHIEDNGIGIQSKSEESDKKIGGFGISIMKERAKLLNGTFTLTTENQKGTAIDISIPIIEKGEE